MRDNVAVKGRWGHALWLTNHELVPSCRALIGSLPTCPQLCIKLYQHVIFNLVSYTINLQLWLYFHGYNSLYIYWYLRFLLLCILVVLCFFLLCCLLFYSCLVPLSFSWKPVPLSVELSWLAISAIIVKKIVVYIFLKLL